MGKLAILQLRRPHLDDIDRKCIALNEKYGNTPDYILDCPINNFAEARNQLQQDALSYDPEIEWFLWIDSDEVFPHKLRFGSTTIGIEFPRYNLFFDEDHYRIDSNCYPDYQLRLVRSDAFWVNKVHECAIPRISNPYKVSEHIYHYGWLKDKRWQVAKHARFHYLAKSKEVWLFPSLEEVTLKKLPEEKVIRLG